MKNLAKLISKDGLPLTYMIFYTVGLLLYFFPETRQLFILITPYSLFFIAISVFYYHKRWDFKTVAVLLAIFTISILVEIIGVASGKLFGVYKYSEFLGFQIANVPVIIGLNWVILIYGSNAIISKYTTNSILKIAGASMLMVVYDIVLEKAAPLMKMWKFESDNPPFQNYLMWFLLAIFFHSIIEIFNVNTNNKPARALFIIQFLFFTVIVIYSLLFI